MDFDLLNFQEEFQENKTKKKETKKKSPRSSKKKLPTGVEVKTYDRETHIRDCQEVLDDIGICNGQGAELFKESLNVKGFIGEKCGKCLKIIRYERL